MSSIKLSPNASGTGEFTIAAPNSNTNRTLTLPDATGTLNMSGVANEVPAGSAGSPAIYPTGDTNTGIFFPAADTIAFAEGGVESARIDSSGNLLVGTTTSLGKVTSKGNSSFAAVGATGDSTGELLFYNSSNAKYWGIQTNQGTFFIADADFSHYAYLLQNMTSWQFGSDRRMKKDIVDLEYGLDAVMAIKPKRYTFIASGKEDIGFIAQELREVVPEAVSGEEIEYLETDTPQERASKSLGVGKELLIPVLVKAIQEQQAIINQLTARIEALEAK